MFKDWFSDISVHIFQYEGSSGRKKQTSENYRFYFVKNKKQNAILNICMLQLGLF